MTPTWLVDPALHWTLRASLALLWLTAAAHKLRDLRQFVQALAAYDLVPVVLRANVARAIVVLEATIGLTLVASDIALPAVSSATLLAAYSVAIGINLVRGRRIDCGCVGPALRVPLGNSLLVRNGLLIVASLMLCLGTTTRALVWLDVATVIAATATGALLYTASATAFANGARLAPVREA